MIKEMSGELLASITGGIVAIVTAIGTWIAARRMFSRMAINSISGVMMPLRA